MDADKLTVNTWPVLACHMGTPGDDGRFVLGDLRQQLTNMDRTEHLTSLANLITSGHITDKQITAGRIIVALEGGRYLVCSDGRYFVVDVEGNEVIDVGKVRKP